MMAELHSDTRVNKSEAGRSSNDKSKNSKESVDSEKVMNQARGGETDLLSLCEQLLPEKNANPVDLLAVALFVFISENGFFPFDGDQQIAQDSILEQTLSSQSIYRLPSDWKTVHCGSYSFNYILPEFPDYFCRVVATPLADLLLINAVSTSPDITFSVCLDPKRFTSIQNKSSEIKLIKVNELLTKLKDSIITPTRSAALSFRGIPSASLTGLPREILVRILLMSGPYGVCCLSRTCRFMRIIAKDQFIWHTFYTQDYNASSISSFDFETTDWYQCYKDKYNSSLTPNKKTKIFYYPYIFNWASIRP